MQTISASPRVISGNILPGERLHFMYRKHWAVITAPLLLLILFLILAVGITFSLSFLFKISLLLATLIALFILLLTFAISVKIITDWMFNLYIITDRKIAEVKINPMFSDTTSEVLIDQVRCTEIDVINDGIVNQILNKGNVILTFDRPTHRDEFVLSDIPKPREVGRYLSNALALPPTQTRNLWYKDRKKNTYIFTEHKRMEMGGDFKV